MEPNAHNLAHSVALALLVPFDSDAPAGVDPRGDTSPLSRYFRLRDARADARAGERGFEQDGRGVQTDGHWQRVEENARAILIDVGKDLEVAAWLTEALVRRQSLPGLAAGATLMTGLVRDFWSGGLFPSKDEDGEDPRGIPLAGLNGVSGDGTLLQSLRMTVLFYRADQTAVTLWQYEQAEDVEGLGDAARKKRRLAAGIPSLTALDSDARSLGQSHLQATRDDAVAALIAWDSLGKEMDAVLGVDAPPTSRIAGILQKIIRVADKLAPRQLGTVDPSTAPAEDAMLMDITDPNDLEKQTIIADNTTTLVTRDDMLRNLLTVAEYFRTHEPHSPLSYALEEAVRRGRMSFFELLQEVVPDLGTRSVILSQLGIRPPEA
ncbi:type VI secretion system protein TssA [Acidisoma silvae]|uniref:Type VI secretion system protein TssA n=1 Tax=Acidisoma silvae TaxID=2802396 RepID=A0A964E0B3_9PROT|nr:type VI secretion system protein TssA [Acidisoma silvae]MCB8876977.1 type VI secretion system protein TssA [Acidisoma silvae]